MNRIVKQYQFCSKRTLTSELFVDGSLLKVLFTVDETASSMSPTKVSSFNAVSGNYNEEVVRVTYFQIKMSKEITKLVRHKTTDVDNN